MVHLRRILKVFIFIFLADESLALGFLAHADEEFDHVVHADIQAAQDRIDKKDEHDHDRKDVADARGHQCGEAAGDDAAGGPGLAGFIERRDHMLGKLDLGKEQMRKHAEKYRKKHHADNLRGDRLAVRKEDDQAAGKHRKRQDIRAEAQNPFEEAEKRR